MGTVSHSEAFEVSGPVGKVFPLFSPEGEKLWVPGWDYENVMGSASLSEDYVFITRTHDHASGRAVWLVKRYDPESYLVELYKVEPDEKVGIVTVACSAFSEERTRVKVTYRYIALSEKGEEFISGFTREYYKEFIGEWEGLLNEYFGPE